MADSLTSNERVPPQRRDGVIVKGPLAYPLPPRCADCGFTIDDGQPRKVRATRDEDADEWVEIWSCCAPGVRK